MTSTDTGALLESRWPGPRASRTWARILAEQGIAPAQYVETMELLDRFLQCRINGEELRRKDFEDGLSLIFSDDRMNIHRFFHALARVVAENKLWFASRAVFRRR